MEEHQKKIIVMRILVASIAFFIFIFWVFNIPKVWEGNKTILNNNDIKMQELREEINSSLADMEKKLDNIEEKTKLTADAGVLLEGVLQNVEHSSSTLVTATSSPLNVTASTTASTSAPVVPKNINCPPYINCMPSIDEIRSCQIPAGCEGVTQVAY